MRRLNLDFHATPGRPWAAILTLTCGVLLLSAAVVQYQYAARELARLEDALLNGKRADKKTIQQPQSQPTARPTAEQTREMAAARQVMQQLTLPWERLFFEIEAATDKHVALLAIEPDAKKMRITLIAEASSPQEMLNYVKRLEASAMFSDVILQRHELQLKDPDKPVRFTLEGKWRDRP